MDGEPLECLLFPATGGVEQAQTGNKGDGPSGAGGKLGAGDSRIARFGQDRLAEQRHLIGTDDQRLGVARSDGVGLFVRQSNYQVDATFPAMCSFIDIRAFPLELPEHPRKQLATIAGTGSENQGTNRGQGNFSGIGCRPRRAFDRQSHCHYDCAPMSTGGLPRQVAVRKLAAVGAELKGTFKVAELERLRQALADDSGSGEFRFEFATDEEGRPVMTGEVSATVTVCCQRCLQPMQLVLHSVMTTGIVHTDAQAKALPEELAPLLAGVEPIDLADVLEDELLIELPIVAMHPPDACATGVGYVSNDPEFEERSEETAENPFSVLEQLKKR